MRNIIYKTVINDSKEGYFSGVTLGKNDIIKDGGHKVKVSTFLKRHGKEGVIALLPYYDLEEEILEEYHIHLQTPAEKARREKEKLEQEKAEQMNNVQDNATVSVPEEEIFETSVTEVEEDDNWAYDLNEEDYLNSVLYDEEDDPMDSSFFYPCDSGWESHSYGGVPVGNVRKPII